MSTEIFKVASYAFLLSLLFAFPSYDLVKDEFGESWDVIIKQTNAPLEHREYPKESHAANLTFRLTPVLFGIVFNIHSAQGYLVLQLIAFYILIVHLVAIFHKLLGNTAAANILAFSISMTFLGGVLCSDYRGFFDVVSFLFLVISAYYSSSLIVFFAAILAFYTDERALICSTLLYIFFALDNTALKSCSDVISAFLKPKGRALALVFAWASYLGIRWFLSYRYGLETNFEGMLEYLIFQVKHHINVFPLALWSGLEGLWIIVVAMFYLLYKNRHFAPIPLIVLAMSLVIGVSLWTFDITRSMAYLFPVIFLCLRIMLIMEGRGLISRLAPTVLIGCILPTYYVGGASTVTWLLPFHLQMLRMLFF